MSVLAIIVGVALIMLAVADLLNTLVSTSTSNHRYWPTFFVGNRVFALVRTIAQRLREDSRARERLLSMFAPAMFLLLLAMWVSLQVVGFGLIWWGLDGGFGFGEVLPADTVPQVGAIAEAFSGVITIALVIGSLPSLYSAYSEREQQLMRIDDGSDDRITPTNPVIAWAPDAEWERWTANILETPSTLPRLRLFRSHGRRQFLIDDLLCPRGFRAPSLALDLGDLPESDVRTTSRTADETTRNQR